MKNIVIFIDGTGQDRSQQELAGQTNVARLCLACSNIKGQKVHYYNGVGTGVGESILGGAFGIGLEERILKAYSFLQQEVGIARQRNEEYHIYLFGFSRGAFAVRWLAELVEFSGIPAFGVSERLGVVNLFRGKKEDAEALRKSGQYYDADIQFIGVWDTVQSTLTQDFGISSLPKNVSAAYHAMALDEYRAKFPVSRFDADVRVKEVWFAGCHTDVGGGYVDGRATADCSLKWILDGAKECGLVVNEDALSISNQLSEPVIHDELESAGFTGFLWRAINFLKGEKRVVRQVEPNDVIHWTVNAFASQYSIMHEQSLAACTEEPQRFANIA